MLTLLCNVHACMQKLSPTRSFLSVFAPSVNCDDCFCHYKSIEYRPTQRKPQKAVKLVRGTLFESI